MGHLMFYSVLLIILCSYSKCDDLSDICRAFKANGVFDGIKVYNKYIETEINKSNKEYKHFMYKNGKEWQFMAEFNELADVENVTFMVGTQRDMRRDSWPVMHRFTYRDIEFDVIILSFILSDNQGLPRQKIYYD